MNQESIEKVLHIQEAIERLKNGDATKEDVKIVKEYVALVKEMIDIFEGSVTEVLTKSAHS